MTWWGVVYDWLGSDQSANLAMWVGGVGTVGALLFGFAQLQRQRIDKKREQADQVIVTHLVGDDGGDEGDGLWVVSVRNGSDKPIYHVRLVVKRNAMWKNRLLKTNPPMHLVATGHEAEMCEALVPDYVAVANLSTYRAVDSTIEPNEERIAQFDTCADRQYYDVLLTLRDASNRTWHIDVSPGQQQRYLSMNAANRMLDRVEMLVDRIQRSRSEPLLIQVKQASAVSIRDDRARVQLEGYERKMRGNPFGPKLKFAPPSGSLQDTPFARD